MFTGHHSYSVYSESNREEQEGWWKYLIDKKLGRTKATIIVKNDQHQKNAYISTKEQES